METKENAQISLDDKIGLALMEEVSFTDLRPYNYMLVYRMEKQIKYVKHLISDIMSQIKQNRNDELMLNFAFLKFYRDRCVRILRSYLYNRFRKIEEISNLLSDDEIKMFREIQDLEEEYTINFSSIDFIASDPPFSIYVYVYVKEKCCVYDEDTGYTDLLIDRMYFLRKTMVEQLIKLGSLVVIDRHKKIT